MHVIENINCAHFFIKSKINWGKRSFVGKESLNICDVA